VEEEQHIGRATRRAVLAGIAATLAPGAQAQQREGKRRLGVLTGGNASQPEGQADAAALVQGLSAFGWHEDGNLRIDWRWAGSDPTLYERYAAELLSLGSEVLLGVGTPSVVALRRRTSTVPIVFVQVNDPVAQGFVATLARPGGTLTGFSAYDPPMAGKWLGMLTQITPPIAHVAVLFNPATTPFAGPMLHAIEEAAPSLTVAVRAAPCRDDGEIETIMAGLQHERSGLLVLPSAFTSAYRDAIVAIATQHRLPAIYPYRDFALIGGLMSYGFDYTDLFRRAAAYVDRILKGEKPGDLPVQRPDKFDLVINLKTAKALGITIAPSLLATADEVIE
jgi:putative tryptophan/tyrosine transport system substrate-binding protein